MSRGAPGAGHDDRSRRYWRRPGVLALTLVWAPSASAAPRMTVSADHGPRGRPDDHGERGRLHPEPQGDRGRAVQGRATPVPNDCNLAGGATFRNADATGSIGTVTLKVATSFGGIDCIADQVRHRGRAAAQLLHAGGDQGQHRDHPDHLRRTSGPGDAAAVGDPHAETPQASETPEATAARVADRRDDGRGDVGAERRGRPAPDRTDGRDPRRGAGRHRPAASGLGLALLLPMRRRHGGPA